ncbi:MAG: DNA gyrase inhibitor YacG [Caulobacteraceae bacterium]
MTAPTCPICLRPAQRAFAPFCSRRCADVDLQRWLGGVYAIPAREDDEPVDPDAEDEADSVPGQVRRPTL